MFDTILALAASPVTFGPLVMFVGVIGAGVLASALARF